MRNPPLVLISCLASIFACAPPAESQETLQAALRARFEADINRVGDHLDGVLGFAIKDLSSGETFFRLPDTVFPQASSIKLAVLLELLRQAQEHKISLDEEHTVHRREMTVGDDEAILNKLGDGTVTMTLGDLATFMVVLSDNSATNILIERLGMENINAGLARLGLKETQLRRRMINLDAARQGNENVSTPREMLTLLEKVRAGQALDAAHTAEFFRLLWLPKESPFRRALPGRAAIADKPGELEGVRCDSGIIEIPNRPIILAVMTTYLAHEEDGERAIEEIAKLAYAHFSRVGAWSRYGRAIPEK
jgi:beta-lactamase class A